MALVARAMGDLSAGGGEREAGRARPTSANNAAPASISQALASLPSVDELPPLDASLVSDQLAAAFGLPQVGRVQAGEWVPPSLRAAPRPEDGGGPPPGGALLLFERRRT